MDETRPRNTAHTRHGVIVCSETHHTVHLATVLKEIGLEVKAYGNVKQTLAGLNPKEPPAVIVIDHLLSERAWKRFSRLLRSLKYKAFYRTSILIVSPPSVAGEFGWRIVCEVGADTCLSESLDDERLKRLIGIHLERTAAATPPPVLIGTHDRHRNASLRRVFEARGDSVICAASSTRARSLMEKQAPGVIILDDTFSNREGALHEIRRDCPCAAIVVLSETALNDRTACLSRRESVVFVNQIDDPENVVFLSMQARTWAAVHALSQQVEPHIHYSADSTERMLAEQAIRQTQARAQSYLDVAEVMLIALNKRGEVELINRKGCLILGYAEDELIGRDWFASCLPRRDNHTVRTSFERIIAGEIAATEYYENCVVTKAGEERLVAWHNALIRDDAGVIIGTVSSGEDITDRRRAEERLRQSEEKYRHIFAHASEGIFQTTPDGHYISINPAFAGMFGYASPEEMIATVNDIGYQVYVHPEEREKLKQVLSRDGHAEGFEAEVFRKDGARIWISINAHIVRDADGSIRYYEGTNVDITARKKNEMALKAVLEGTIAFVGRDYFPSLVQELAAVLGVRYAFIGELVPGQSGYIRSVAFEADGKAIAHEMYARLGGTPSETVLAKGLCVYPENVQAIFPHAAELKRLQVVSYMGTPLYTRTQELLGLLAVMDDKPMEQGEPARSLLTIFAARAGAELERVRTDSALKESEERYRYLVENSHELVAEISTDNRFIYISPNHRDLLGYDLADLLRRDITELVHPDDLPQVLPKLDQPEGTAIFRYRHKDGSWRWLDAAGRRFVTPTGEERIVVVSRDITERKLAEQERQSLQEQLILAQKMESIGRLAGGVAHDFSNLLTPILGFTEVLLNDLPPGDPRQELLLPILEAAERAKDLTHQLLVFSHKQALELKTVDLGAAIVRFQKLLRRTIREDIWLTVRVAPSLGLVKADVGQIEQVLMNLSVNAQDAMPKGGLLSIELKNVDLDNRTVKSYPGTTPGSYVLLSVTDTGGGMNRETLDHLFEPFYTTKTPGQGTGLGLSIVHGIIKQHGGIICCISEPGCGTTFRIYLPRLQEAVIQPSPGVPPPYNLKRGSETVLIVDDNQAVRDLASRVLKHQGYQVIVAENTDHCLEIVDRQRTHINLLLTDLIMPVMNGRELYEHLHSVQPAMKVLYMSSYTGDIIARHGVSQEELSFIQKPFTIETLAKKVRNILDTTSSHQQ